MMGSNGKPQDELFYAFNLDEMVPQDHLLRDIDRVLDLSNLREHLAPYYSHTGRPSVDPELMIRMLLIGYCCGIRSERQLCYEVSMNLAYRWFCKLKITDQVPHHSTFSKNRPPPLPQHVVRYRSATGNGRCHGHNASSGYSPSTLRPADNAAGSCG